MRRSTVRAAAAGLLCSVVLSACEMSEVDPDAEVRIDGRVVTGEGTPVGGAPVVLLTEPTLADVAFGLPFGLASVGFACLADDPPPPCDTRRRLAADAGGAFGTTVTGRETQGLLGTAARMTVTSSASPEGVEVAGPATTGAFVVQSETVELEPLALVRAGPTLGVDGGTAVVDWGWPGGAAMRGAPGTPVLVFEVARSPAWIAPAQDRGVDARVLEDAAGTVGVVEHRRAEGTIDDLTYRSEQVPYTAPVAAPPSRGATCLLAMEDGTDVPLVPCPLTDGDLVTAASRRCDELRSPDGCADAHAYQVDLGAPVALDLVVLRGCTDGCQVLASEDGASWRLLGEVVEPYTTLHDGAAARYLRVALDPVTSEFAEVSVWDAPTQAVSFAVDEARIATSESGTADEAQGGAEGATGDSGLRWAWVLLALAVVAVAAAGGAAWGRRSREEQQGA